MFEFARWVSSEAPNGHPGHRMIALAHIEGWITPAPWHFLGKPVQVYEQARQYGSQITLRPTARPSF